jgi:hypothetical protein
MHFEMIWFPSSLHFPLVLVTLHSVIATEASEKVLQAQLSIIDQIMIAQVTHLFQVTFTSHKVSSMQFETMYPSFPSLSVVV